MGRRKQPKNTSLTPKELEVKNLVIKGLSNKEIASDLFITEKTVKFHISHIYKKLDVKSRSQLIASHYNPGVLVKAELNPQVVCAVNEDSSDLPKGLEA